MGWEEETPIASDEHAWQEVGCFKATPLLFALTKDATSR
jgi:hypothetical protein